MSSKLRNIFVHLHIPKCGGTTINDVLSRNFFPNLVTTKSILNDYQYDTSQVSRIIDQNTQLKCLTGHKLSLDLPYDRTDLIIHAFTWIRDPVDRFVSHYFYHRNHTNLVPEAKIMDFNEYVEWALKYENQKMYINGQIRFLSGGSMEKIKSMVECESLFLFPLSKLQQSLYTLANRFPNEFTDIKIKNKNISKKDHVLPPNYRMLVYPYVENDMRLLELSLKTTLDTGCPQCKEGQYIRNYKIIRRHIALKAIHILDRISDSIRNRC